MAGSKAGSQAQEKAGLSELPPYVCKNAEHVEEALHRVFLVSKQITEQNLEHEERLRELNDDHAAEVAPLGLVLSELEKALLAYAEKHCQEKKLVVSGGCVGLRKFSQLLPTVDWDDVLLLAKRASKNPDVARCITIKESLSRTALKKLEPKLLEKVGLRVVSGKQPFYSLKN